MKKLILLLILVGVVVTGYFASQWLVFLAVSPGDGQQKIVFEVPPGATLWQTARKLKEQGLIRDVRKFVLYAKVMDKTTSLRVGEYEVSSAMTPPEVLTVLTSGVSVSRPITFQEGLNIFEIAEILDKRGFAPKDKFLALCKNRDFIQKLLGRPLSSVEGYLFPETYFFTKYAKAETIIEAMVKRFKAVYKDLGNPAFKAGLNSHQIVILASIIEKETGAPEERPLIASVFHNRLRKGMRLQSDPTIIYGIADKTGEMIKNIRRKHIDAPTRYNTYTKSGLPYGPIANPGKEAIRAVLEPENSSFLYFVSKNDGTHYFSKNYREHLKAVRQYQLSRKARQGKSWRDLKKQK
jgi:UPF0755 protein